MLSCILVVILSVFTCVFVFSSNLQDTMNQQAYSQTMLLVHILETSKDDPVSALEKIKNEIYGRITFMDKVWGDSYVGESRTIDMHIKTLRQKLENGGDIIKTIRGVGYKVE